MASLDPPTVWPAQGGKELSSLRKCWSDVLYRDSSAGGWLRFGRDDGSVLPLPLLDCGT